MVELKDYVFGVLKWLLPLRRFVFNEQKRRI